MMGSSRSEYKPTDFTDAGNAAVFHEQNLGLAAYCDALGWLCWDGQRWVADEHKASLKAMYLTDCMLAEAVQDLHFTRRELELDKDSEEAKAAYAAASEYQKHALKSRGAGKIRGMLELASHSMVISADRLDAAPFLLNTPGGIVDLRTGELLRHDIGSPNKWCTHMTSVIPIEDEDGMKEWVEFLQTVCCGDYNLYKFLNLAVGSALIGRVYYEGIFLAVGGGRNGKSTLFNALLDVLGDYGGTIDPDVLTTSRDKKGAALATLRGKRLVIASEMEEHQRLSSSTLKRIASTDKLTIEEKYRAPATIDQTHTLVLFTNFLPRVGSTDDGTWRRIIVMPFNATIDSGKEIKNYSQQLVERCGPAILWWAISGAVEFIQNGFKLELPDAVRKATEEYRMRENWLEQFLEDRCERGPSYKIQARELYLEYKNWAADYGEYPHREREFSDAMSAAGFIKKTPGNKRVWYGLKCRYEYYGGGYGTNTG